ncbi:MAG: hypothetical protein ACXV8S_16140, partial [Methylobacter sp.]
RRFALHKNVVQFENSVEEVHFIYPEWTMAATITEVGALDLICRLSVLVGEESYLELGIKAVLELQITKIRQYVRRFL